MMRTRKLQKGGLLSIYAEKYKYEPVAGVSQVCGGQHRLTCHAHVRVGPKRTIVIREQRQSIIVVIAAANHTVMSDDQ